MMEWGQAKNILCVRLDSIGDILMSSPAICALKDALPGRRITLLTSRSGAEVARLIPVIDDVIIYEAPWMKASVQRTDSRVDQQMLEILREHQFDGEVIFTVYSQNPLPAAMLGFLADIPLRLAYCHENPYQLLTDWAPDPEPQSYIRHEVRRQLDLVKSIGIQPMDERMVINIPLRDKKSIISRLDHLGVDLKKPFIVIHPGATASSRRYSDEKYTQIADELIIAHKQQIIFTGDSTERGLVNIIRQKMQGPTWSLAGELSLGEMAALLSMSNLLISNNTGPVHVAAALNRPVVVLYALTNPQHTPWMTAHRVLYHDVPCKFCYKSICPMIHHDCLEKISPQQVINAALDLLGSTSEDNLVGEVLA